MPYRTVSSAREAIPALEGFSDSEVEQFITVFNNLISDGVNEGEAIPRAIGSVDKADPKNTPAKPNERRTGSSKNPSGSASSGSAKINFSEKVTNTLKEKVKNHNESSSKKVTLRQLKAVYRRGAGAFSTSHHPNANRHSWSMGRVNSFLRRVKGGDGHSQDDDLIRKLENVLYFYDDECLSMLEKADTSDVTRDDKGNLVLRGEKFAGYGKPMRDSGSKQGKVLVKEGNTVKIVRFGDPSLRDNYSVEANNRFYDRFGGRPQIDDKMSPLYWSARWLWPKGNKGGGAKPFYTLKK